MSDVYVAIGSNVDPESKSVYPKDINFAIAEGLKPLEAQGWEVVMASLNDADQGISDNFALAERYGIPLKKGVPAFAVLEPDGRVVYAQKNGEFESMRSMDPRSVNEFLVRWQGPAR